MFDNKISGQDSLVENLNCWSIQNLTQLKSIKQTILTLTR